MISQYPKTCLLLIVLLFTPITLSSAKEYDFSSITKELKKSFKIFEGRISYLIQKKDGTILAKEHLADDNTDPYTDESAIHIASGCKWPAMATVMKLIEQKKLSFQNTIGDFYKKQEFTNIASSIKVQQLMTHSSGFGYFDDWCAAANITLQDSVLGIANGGKINGKHVCASPVKNYPGTTVLYGDIGMQVLGAITEKATKKGFNQLFQELIAQPLNMKNAKFTPCDGEEGINIAIADGLKIRMQDYANFMLMLMNGGKFNGVQVLEPESVVAMLKDYTYNLKVDPTNVEIPPNNRLSFGLGSWIYEDGNIFSSNGIYGFSNYFDVKNEYLTIFYVKSENENVEDVLLPYQEKIRKIIMSQE